MKKEEKTTLKCGIPLVWELLIIAIMLLIGFYVWGNTMQEVRQSCDDKYGINGWDLNETTSTGECKGYIGQCWECVPKGNEE